MGAVVTSIRAVELCIFRVEPLILAAAKVYNGLAPGNLMTRGHTVN